MPYEQNDTRRRPARSDNPEVVVFSVIFAYGKLYCASHSLKANIISLQTEFAISLLIHQNITPSKMEHHLKFVI